MADATTAPVTAPATMPAATGAPQPQPQRHQAAAGLVDAAVVAAKVRAIVAADRYLLSVILRPLVIFCHVAEAKLSIIC